MSHPADYWNKYYVVLQILLQLLNWINLRNYLIKTNTFNKNKLLLEPLKLEKGKC